LDDEPREQVARKAATRSNIGVQLLERDLFEPAIAQEKHPPCPRQERCSVGDDDAGNGKRGDEFGDALDDKRKCM
jgi:hypothetical protein